MPSARETRNLLTQRDLPEAKQNPEGGHVDRQSIPGTNGTRPRIKSGTDTFTVNDGSRKRMGVLPHEDVCLIRKENWQNIGEDRPGEFLDANEGSRIPVKENGKPFMNGDLIYAVRPKDCVEELRSEEAYEYEQYEKEHDPNQPRRYYDDDGNVIGPNDYEAISRQNLGVLRRQAQNSQTAGMQLEKAFQLFNEEQIQRHEATAAIRNKSSFTVDDYRERAEEWKKQEKSRDSGGTGRRTFSLGAGLKDGKVVR